MRTPEEVAQSVIDWINEDDARPLLNIVYHTVKDRDAEVRRDTIEKAKAVVLSWMSDHYGHDPHYDCIRDTKSVGRILDALLQEEEKK